MMWGMAVAGREIHQEWVAGRRCMLGPYPVDASIRHIADENVIGITERWHNGLGILEQSGMPVVRIAAQEAVEILKTQARRPLIEWPGSTLLPVRYQMVLAEP